LTTQRADGLVFLATQLRPIEEAQKMRKVILKDFPREVDYVTERPPQLPVRIKAEQQGGTHTIDVIGALHGELQPLVPLDALATLDDLARKLNGRGIPDPLMTLGKFGTAHQLHIPWMQASYIMVANREALPYLPLDPLRNRPCPKPACFASVCQLMLLSLSGPRCSHCSTVEVAGVRPSEIQAPYDPNRRGPLRPIRALKKCHERRFFYGFSRPLSCSFASAAAPRQ
jgi:hypothetical protein